MVYSHHIQRAALLLVEELEKKMLQVSETPNIFMEKIIIF